MATETKVDLLAAFFDGGVSTPLFGGSAVTAAYGMVGGQPAYAVCQNGGALSASDLTICTKTAALAAKTGNPLVTFYDSTGMTLTDGLESLAAVKALNEATALVSGVVPQLAVVTGVCGASSAMAAAGADLVIMTQNAELFLTAPFVSAAAGDLPEGAGGAEWAVKAGVAAMVVEEATQAAVQAARLITLLPANNLASAPGFEFSAPAGALDMAKYSGEAAIEAVVDEGSAVELYKGFGSGVVTSLATVNGSVVGVVATAGSDTVMGNWCITRAARFVRLCDAFSIPVVTMINSGGFEASSSSDEAGAIRNAARLAATYADATTAKVAVLCGRAVGTLYTAMGSADLTIAVEGTVVSPAEPSAVVTVLYKDEIDASGNVAGETAARVRIYEAEQASAAAAVKAGLADVIATPAAIRTSVATALDVLLTKRTQRLAKKHGNMAL